MTQIVDSGLGGCVLKALELYVFRPASLFAWPGGLASSPSDLGSLLVYCTSSPGPCGVGRDSEQGQWKLAIARARGGPRGRGRAAWLRYCARWCGAGLWVGPTLLGTRCESLNGFLSSADTPSARPPLRAREVLLGHRYESAR